MGDRPGDLALVQMALTETWDRRRSFGDDLLRAYAGIGRIEGAIARAAEDVYAAVLDDAERALAEPVFVRLVRLGDTGGATRRLATRGEFNDAKWRLIQKLASKEAKRLVLIGGGETAETVEIAHEALVTQWPRYQTWLSGRDPDGADRAADKRTLDALTQRTAGWVAAPDARAKAKRLATGADLRLRRLGRAATGLAVGRRTQARLGQPWGRHPSAAPGVVAVLGCRRGCRGGDHGRRWRMAAAQPCHSRGRKS